MGFKKDKADAKSDEREDVCGVPMPTSSGNGGPLSKPGVVDRYFEISGRSSSVSTEVRGGCVTFLTMSYILLVNPQILAAWTDGSEFASLYASDVATSTALTCGLGCIVVGLLARLPLAVGPAMGLNTLMAGMFMRMCAADDSGCDFIEEAQRKFSLACTTCFIMGSAVLVLTLVNLTSLVLVILPNTLKTAIMVGIGAFQAFVGMRKMKIIRPTGDADILQLEGFGVGGLDFSADALADPTGGWAQLLFFFCLIFMSVLFRKGVKGSMLIALVLTTAISWTFGIGGGRAVAAFKMPTLDKTPLQVDFVTWFADQQDTGSCLGAICALFLVTIFDVGGVQVGMAKAIDIPSARAKARLSGHVGSVDVLEEDNDILPGRCSQMIFGSVAVSTMFSAVLGCSPCIVFLEGAAGVHEGAKTGLASVVTGVLFFVASFFTPLFQHVPACASAAPLIFIGCLMMNPVGEIQWGDLNHALPAFLCILMMPFTGSVTPGVLFGLATYGLMRLATPSELFAPPREVMKAVLSPAPTPRTTPLLAKTHSPGSRGRSQSHDSRASETSGGSRDPIKTVTKLGRNAAGVLTFVDQEVVEPPKTPNPMDDIYRPTPVAQKDESVVSASYIGAPR